MAKRHIPSELKRELRQESLFGCVLCGSPIIEYHHIIPFHQIKTHVKEEMVVLCPEHHHRADCGEIPRDVLYQHKNTPINANKHTVSKDFYLLNYPELRIVAGSNTFVRVPIILQVDGFSLIVVKGDGSHALVSAKFFNSHNKLLAEIKDNEWIAYKDRNIWDIEYSPGHLKINSEKRNILLDLTINENTVKLRGKMYFNGFKIDFEPHRTVIGSNTMMLNSSTISDCHCGISVSTRELREHTLRVQGSS